MFRRVAGNLRSLTRFNAVFLWIIFVFAPFAVAAAVTSRSGTRFLIIRRMILSVISKGILTIAGVRTVRSGEAPERPYILVSNHVSWLDIVVFGAFTGCAFVSKSAVGRWPLVGAVARRSGAIFIDRQSFRALEPVNRKMTRSLKAGEGVHIFVESTTSYGRDILPFRSTLLDYPANASMGVHAAAIRYHTPEPWPAASLAVAWVDWTPLPAHMLRLLRLPTITAEVTYSATPSFGADRKELARRLETEVKRIHRPMV